MSSYSVSPAGEEFPLPGPEDDARELERIERLVAQARGDGREIVVVMGVGFVGAVMAAIVADTVRARPASPSKFVIGCQRPEHAQLLEDPAAQPRRVAGQGRGPRGRRR